jgi:spermidine/putrescine transport system permease protein
MTEQAIASNRPAAGAEPFEFDHGKIRRDMLMRRVGKIGLMFNPIFSYFFLWAPILLLVLFSFDDSRSVATWQGFTLQWYNNIFHNIVGTEARFSTGLMVDALGNSLIIAFFATFIATSIGTMVALSLARGNYPGKKVLDSVLYLPVVIPEITQGISLLIFFNILFDFWGNLTGTRGQFGFITIIISHVAFNISYVAIVVRARLADMNPRLEEAARDLGANEWKTFWRITFPLILPGVIAGALLAFTLSLDDFVITFFTTGVGTTTLPIFVYGLLKLSVTPEINAISTLILIASTVLIGVSLAIQGRNAVKAA